MFKKDILAKLKEMKPKRKMIASISLLATRDMTNNFFLVEAKKQSQAELSEKAAALWSAIDSSGMGNPSKRVFTDICSIILDEEIKFISPKSVGLHEYGHALLVPHSHSPNGHCYPFNEPVMLYCNGSLDAALMLNSETGNTIPSKMEEFLAYWRPPIAEDFFTFFGSSNCPTASRLIEYVREIQVGDIPDICHDNGALVKEIIAHDEDMATLDPLLADITSKYIERTGDTVAETNPNAYR